MLAEAGLPRFSSSFHDPDIDELQLTWDHRLTLHIDLTRGELAPIDDFERGAILNLPPGREPIHVVVPGSADDPRSDASRSSRIVAEA